MDANQTLIFAVFMIGYALFTVEHLIRSNKSGIALLLAAVLWAIVYSFIPDDSATEGLLHSGAEIVEITIFLLCAMSLVEVIVHFGFFEWVKYRLLKLGLSDQKQFYVIAVVTFFTSALLDNLTTTIIMIQVARSFYGKENLPLVASGIVVLANAGGAWSPLGDVTTIMLWVADKFSAGQVIVEAILPSSAMAVVSTLLLGRKLSKKKQDDEAPMPVVLTKIQKTIVGIAMSGFAYPIIFSMSGIAPFLGLMFGLGIVWVVMEYNKGWTKNFDNIPDSNLEHLLRKVDIQSIMFFIGILFAVGALREMHILEMLSLSIFGENASFMSYVRGSTMLGVASAVFDNVPLTAAAMDLIQSTDHRLWVFLAFTVGTGGSLLLIGSAAGVVAGGMVKELTFIRYMRINTIPVLIAYAAGVAVWYVQYLLTS